MSTSPPSTPEPGRLAKLLDAAVEAVGGTPRPGQQSMAEAVAAALDHRDHLLVQAGTGTGKSLAYLVPALAHGKRVVVATATLALQRQLVAHDLPLLAGALESHLGRKPTFAVLKGRNNYICLHRVNDGAPDDGDGLFDLSSVTSPLGREVVRAREWAAQTETGDRDDLSPGVGDRAWGQISVGSRECLGAAKCPYSDDCFSETAREKARMADVVVTNHALLAIDTFDGEVQVLPEHDAVIIDEGHELVNRATGAVTGELTPGLAGRAARGAGRLIGEERADRLQGAVDAFTVAIDATPAGRLRHLPDDLGMALSALRDAARDGISALTKKREKNADDDEAARRQALAAVQTVFEVCERVLEGGAAGQDVVWLDKHERFGNTLRVAPLSVAGLLRTRLFAHQPTILTSATLKLRGDFDGVALSAGLLPDERLPDDPQAEPETKPEDDSDDDELGPIGWRALDVGSPFDYQKQGILYVARHLDPPGRDGIRPDQLDEIAELIDAAGGRTLGLFSSMRAAEAASAALRERVEFPILCQGEDSLAELLRVFTADVKSCLFGTLSLWQGVNVPGPSCQLVIIDRIPFPRPDDPLSAARQEAIASRGGNGFMAVAASHAGLLLAQGAGRLIRSTEDRGVVAVLDSRLATARYGGFLRASLPPFWATDDGARVRKSLAAINV